MIHKKKNKILIFAAVFIAAVVTGAVLYSQMTDSGGGKTADQSGQEQSTVEPKTEFTEEEKERIESQTGVTVTEEGTVQIDIGAVQAEEESMPVSREEAAQSVISELGEGAEVVSMSVREEQEHHYWAVKATKGDEAYQVWIDAETGDTFLKQEETR